MNTQRKQAEQIDPAPPRPAEPISDWTPLHPMHVDLAQRMTRYADPVIAPLPLPIRAALVIGLAGASWYALWSVVRVAVGLTG